MNGKGYWVKGTRRIEVAASTHLQAVLNEPDDFGVTHQFITACYQLSGEPFGMEGRAREEILRRAMKNGWLRVREHIDAGDQYWTIEGCLIRQSMPSIVAFVRWAVFTSMAMKAKDSLNIIDLETGEGNRYPYQEGGAGMFLDEHTLSEGT